MLAIGVPVLLLILAIGGVFLWAKPPSFSQHQAWLESTVAKIERGELVANSNIVTITGDTPRGAWGERIDTAYVAGSASQRWTIFFPYWRGKGTNIEGFLYVSPARAVTSVSLPVYWGPLGPPGWTPPAPCELEVETPLNANWSIAAWRMD